MRILLLVGVLLGVAVKAAGAAESDTLSFTGYGTGVQVSCGAFMAAVRDTRPDHHNIINGKHFYPESSAYIQWIQGYVSAVNVERALQNPPGAQVNTDVDGMAASISKYCADHPTEPFYMGLTPLLMSPAAGKLAH